MKRTQILSAADAATTERLAVVGKSLKVARAAQKSKPGVRTIEQAAELLANSIGMACPPGACIECQGVFYFSGGTTTAWTTNFTSGFAIEKGATEILFWEEVPRASPGDQKGERPLGTVPRR